MKRLARIASLSIALIAPSACKSTGGDPSDLRVAPRDPERVGEPGATDRTNPAHYKGPFTVDGAYDFAPAALAERYRSLKPARFGTIALQSGDATRWVVRDLHYHLGNDRAGVRPVPVVDRAGRTDDAVAKTADGRDVRGSEVLDALVRKAQGLSDDDDIFALTSFMHPEEHVGRLEELAASTLKLENGHTHLGAYLGQGRTRNAPFDYHDQTWKVRGYPANVSTISLDGVPQATLNRNATIVLRLLNEGNTRVKMPFDYKFDPFLAINLEETLAFFRGWLDPEWVRAGDTVPFQEKLLNDPEYYTYCAEHVMIAVNVALNLPQNEAAYVELWGEADGKRLWQNATRMWTRLTRRDEQGDGNPLPMPVVPAFTPLWKKTGVTAPLASKEIGRGMAWAPETVTDLISAFVEQYASWPDVGGLTAARVILAFAGPARERLGVELPRFAELAAPLVRKMFVAEAKTVAFKRAADPGAAFDAHAQKVQAGLLAILEAAGPAAAALKPVLVDPVAAALAAVRAERLAAEPLKPSAAFEEFRLAIEEDLVRARRATAEAAAAAAAAPPPPPPSTPGAPPPPRRVAFYMSAAVVQRAAANMHAHDSKVRVVTVATAMDPAELVTGTGTTRTYTVEEP